MLTKNNDLSSVTDLIGTDGVFNTDETNQNAIQMLTKVRKAGYLAQPSGYTLEPTDDFWIHMQFEFSAEKSDVTVTRWFITNADGAPISLSKLTYYQLQFLSQTMTDEFLYHSKLYYHELESSFYGERA